MNSNTALSVSNIIQQAIQTVKKGKIPFIQVVAGGHAIIILASLLLGQANPFNSDPAQHPFLYIIWSLLTAAVTILMMVSAIFVLKNTQQNTPVTWKEALRFAASRFWKVLGAFLWYMFLLWVVLLVFALIALALVVLVYSISPSANILVGLVAAVAAIWLIITAMMLALCSIYAVVIDDVGVFEALAYSRRLLKNKYWKTLFAAFAIFVFIFIFSTLVGILQVFLFPLYLVNTFLGIAGTWLLAFPCTVLNSVIGLGLVYSLYTSIKQTEQDNTTAPN